MLTEKQFKKLIWMLDKSREGVSNARGYGTVSHDFEEGFDMCHKLFLKFLAEELKEEDKETITLN